MLQYDLTRTEFFEATGKAQLPNDAEMFAITVALLLVHEAAYTELAKRELELTDADVECVAECIEYRLPVFVRDLGEGVELRERLRNFVGLRVGCVTTLVRSDRHQPK